MFWAKISPVPDETTDLGEISPPRVSRSTSVVRLEGLPGLTAEAACDLVPSCGSVSEIAKPAASESGPWPAQATASPLAKARATATPASAVSRRRRICRRLASRRVIRGSTSLKALRKRPCARSRV